jgi:hypothetical protein
MRKRKREILEKGTGKMVYSHINQLKVIVEYTVHGIVI